MGVPTWIYDSIVTVLFNDVKFVYKPIQAGHATVLIGQFFEVIAKKFLYKSKMVEMPDGWTAYPDLIVWHDRGQDTLIEVKAGYRCAKIDKEQIKAYDEILKQDFPFTNPKLYYVLFSHNIQHITKNYKRIHDLLIALATGIESCYVMPFALVKELLALNDAYTNKDMRYLTLTPEIMALLKAGRKDTLLAALDLMSFRARGKAFKMNGYSLQSTIIRDITIGREYNIDKLKVIFVNSKKDKVLKIKRTKDARAY